MNQLSIKDLSLKEKIAQLFIVGFHGNNCEEDSEVSDLIKEDKPGGVILFDKDMISNKPVRNIESPKQLKKLTNQLQSISTIPLFIGIDQEGGFINRLKPEYGFPETKSHQELGKLDNLKTTRNEGELISATLKEHGVNLNFAPCVDLSINPESSIISKRGRCFGSTSFKVQTHAEAFIEGHTSNNTLSCLKHFPGHGSALGDTHKGFVDVTNSWVEDEIEPYKYLIANAQIPFIMTSHIFNKNLDSNYPATLSSNVINNLLRKKLGFDNVVVSDDMQMRAISDHFDLKESLKLGLEAGLDIFCFGNNLLKDQFVLRDAIELISDLVVKKEITEQRINESVNRILKVKNSSLSR